MTRSITLSNGYGQFHMARLAENLDRRERLRLFLTGGYPRRSFLRLVAGSAFGPIRRLAERHIAIPDERVSSSWAGEIANQLSQQLVHRGHRKLAEPFLRRSVDAYVSHARKAISAEQEGGIYHFRAGMGGSSVALARARGMRTLCDHSIAHPRLLEGLIQGSGGHATALGYLWSRVEEDMLAADAVIVNSDFVARTCVQAGLDPERIHVAYTAVDSSFLNQADAADPDYRFQRPNALFAGTMELRKGVDTVVEAISLVGHAIEWSMIGSWEPDALSSRSRVPDFVRVGPKVPRRELATLLAQCSVFVFPSRAEGSARVVAEALSAGCFVITTEETGSVVRDGIDGAIVRSGDARAVAAAVSSYLALSVGQRRERAALTAAYARDRLSEKRYTSDVLAAYARLESA